MSAPFKADIKAASKKLAEILSEKHSVKIKHGHALEIVSAALGIRDWNTMSAIAKNNDSKVAEPSGALKTVGDLLELIKSLPPSLPLHAEYQYEDSEFDHDGGYSSEGMKRTQDIEAYRSDEGLIFSFEDPATWNTLRETSQSFPSGSVTRSGLDSDEFSSLVRRCEKEINERKGLRLKRQGNNLYLTQVHTFVELDEIREYGPALDEQYGVTIVTDKHNGTFVNDDNGPGYPTGNKEGFIDELKAMFRDRLEQNAFKFFDQFGFSNQISEWESDDLEITAQVKISDSRLQSNLYKLLSEIEDYEYTDEVMDAAGELAGQLELDKRRGK